MKLRILTACLFAAAVVKAQSFKPVLKLTTGKQYTVTESTKGNISQEIMGQSMEIPMDITTTNTLQVKKAEKGTTELSNTTSRIVLATSAMGKDLNFDSDKKEDREGEIGKDIAGLIGKETLFKVNTFGKIVDGSVVKPEGMPEGGMTNPMMGMMSMNGTAQTSGAINLFNSDAQIKVGDSFIDSSTSADGKEKKHFIYTLTGIEKDSVKFDITGSTSLTKEMEAQGMQMTTTMNTKITGAMVVSSASGLLIRKVLNSVIDGSVDVQGMTIPVSGTSSISTTVAEKQ